MAKTRSEVHLGQRSGVPGTLELLFSHVIKRLKNREHYRMFNYSLAGLPPQLGPWQYQSQYESHFISVTAGLQGSFWNTRMLMHQVLFQAVSYLLGFGNLSFNLDSTNELVRTPDPLDSLPVSQESSEC